MGVDVDEDTIHFLSAMLLCFMKYIKEKQKTPNRLQESFFFFSIKNIRIYKGNKRIALDLNDLRKVSEELTDK